MQKNKLLLLTEILKQESDADHPITTNDLIEKLSRYSIHLRSPNTFKGYLTTSGNELSYQECENRTQQCLLYRA